MFCLFVALFHRVGCTEGGLKKSECALRSSGYLLKSPASGL